jgi:hypothetical protein
MANPVKSFQVDQTVLDEIESLRGPLGAKDNSEVIRKALALAKLAAANTGDGHILTILSPGEVRKKINLAD